MDDHPAVGRPGGEVTMGPDRVTEALEVGGVVLRADGTELAVAPEAERHRRERLRAHELAPLPDGRRAAVLGPHVDGHPEGRTLDLALVHRSGRVAADETGAQVGPARDRRQVQAVGTGARRDGLATQSNDSGDSGDPVDASVLSDDRSAVVGRDVARLLDRSR